MLPQSKKGIKMNLRIATVNKAIQQIEPDWELIKGKGYFYWWHPTEDTCLELQTVPVFALNHQSLDGWVSDFVNRQFNECGYVAEEF